MLLIRTIVAALSLLIAFIFPCTPPPKKCAPEFNGTFVQSWMSCTWDDARWQIEIEIMKADGIEYLIIQDLASQTDGVWKLYYDSALPAFEAAAHHGADVVEAALRNCKNSGIKVFIGLALHDSWWVTAGFSDEYAQTCSIMADMVTEIYSAHRQEYSDTIAGWYFTPEIWASTWFSASIDSLSNGINKVIDAINKTDESKPLLLSPFMFENSTTHTLTVALPMWINFFEKVNLRDGDIFCPQDGVGCDIVKLDTIEEAWQMYDKAVKTCRKDIKFWANCENFTLPKESQKGLGMIKVENEGYTVTSTLDRFTRQMEIASHYAENIITFSYNHYYSPNYVNPVFIETYRDYIKNGHTLESSPPTAPAALNARQTDGGVVLSWDSSTDNIGVAFYRICADGKFAGRIEATVDGIETGFTHTETRSSKTLYTVTAYDGAGNSSPAAQIEI